MRGYIMSRSPTDRFRAKPGKALRLSRFPTDVPKLYRSEPDAEDQLQRQVARTLTTLCRAVLQQLSVLDVKSELTPDEASFTAELAARIRANAERYLALAAMLSQVKL